MTEEDIKNVDQMLAQKESFVEMGSIVTKDLTPNQFQGQMHKLNAAMDERQILLLKKRKIEQVLH